jgi:hypothetical protein
MYHGPSFCPTTDVIIERQQPPPEFVFVSGVVADPVQRHDRKLTRSRTFVLVVGSLVAPESSVARIRTCGLRDASGPSGRVPVVVNDQVMPIEQPSRGSRQLGQVRSLGYTVGYIGVGLEPIF